MKNFNPVVTPNKDILIWYFWDIYKKTIEKAIDIKDKASQQPLPDTWKIDAYRPMKIDQKSVDKESA